MMPDVFLLRGLTAAAVIEHLVKIHVTGIVIGAGQRLGVPAARIEQCPAQLLGQRGVGKAAVSAAVGEAGPYHIDVAVQAGQPCGVRGDLLRQRDHKAFSSVAAGCVAHAVQPSRGDGDAAGGDRAGGHIGAGGFVVCGQTLFQFVQRRDGHGAVLEAADALHDHIQPQGQRGASQRQLAHQYAVMVPLTAELHSGDTPAGLQQGMTRQLVDALGYDGGPMGGKQRWASGCGAALPQARRQLPLRGG